jgi:hypothetical protein
MLTGHRPARASTATSGTATDPKTDGNSMLVGPQFNPSKLLISRTFDIEVYERKADGATTVGDLGERVFLIHNCRMTSYSITFTPGQLVSENIGFICIRVQDDLAQPIT